MALVQNSYRIGPNWLHKGQFLHPFLMTAFQKRQYNISIVMSTVKKYAEYNDLDILSPFV